MPASRSSPAANRRVTPTDTACPLCNKVMNRAADLKRHMKNHDPNAERFKCPEEGCTYSTLQKSNLKTHMNQHGETKKKPHPCPDCPFKTSDPGALTRHRERRHEYDPYGRRAAKKAAKRGTAEKDPEPSRRPSVSVAGPSNHAAALEVPPIATLEWTEDSSDSSDAESVKTDQFYPSSVSSEGYDNFAGLIVMTPQPQTPPPSQLLLSSLAPQQVPELKLESDAKLASLDSCIPVRAEALESTLPHTQRRFTPYEDAVAGPSNHATFGQFPYVTPSSSPCSSESSEHDAVHFFDQFAADQVFGFDLEGSAGCTDIEEWEPLDLFTKGQSDLLDNVQPLAVPKSPKSDSGPAAGSAFENPQDNGPFLSSDVAQPSSNPFIGHDFIYPQDPSLSFVSEGYYGSYSTGFSPSNPQFLAYPSYVGYGCA